MEVLCIYNIFHLCYLIINIFKALNIGAFKVRINNRKILTGLFKSLNIAETQMKATLDIVDDLEKLPREKILATFTEQGFNQAQVDKILEFVSVESRDFEILKTLCDHEEYLEGVSELQTVIEALEAMNVDQDSYIIDTSIARGLDYYTGTVYETSLTDHPEFGSVCSGGRYDDLASIFTGKAMPGVGISIGLTRLFSQCLEAGLISPDRSSPTEVLLIAADEVALPSLLSLGSNLREAGIVAENYLETKKLAKQFDYADKLGIPYVIVMGEQELSKKVVQLKDMKTGQSETMDIQAVASNLTQRA